MDLGAFFGVKEAEKKPIDKLHYAQSFVSWEWIEPIITSIMKVKFVPRTSKGTSAIEKEKR